MQCLPKRVRRHLRHSCTGGLKAEFNSWFTPSGLAANDAEPLFLALVLLDSGASARDAQVWAKTVHSALALASTAAAAVLLKSPEWSVRPGGNPGERLALLHAALHRSWSAGTLDAVGAAMQAWRGAGRHDGLRHDHLVRYVTRQQRFPASPRPAGGKRDGPPRWRSAPVLLAVANLIRRDGVELRRLLRLRTPIEDVPTARQELAQAAERVQELEARNLGLAAECGLARDALRKATARVAAARADRKAKVSVARLA